MKTDIQNRQHLTAKEISRWLVEGPEQSASQHVQTCWACQAKLAEAQAPLTTFRGALVEWSEAQAARPMPQTTITRNERHWGLRLWLPVASLALAALLLLGYTKVPGFFHGHSSGQPLVATASATTDSDEALLDQVDTEVSEAVPDAMAPLTDLVAWDSGEGSSTKTPTAEKHSARKTSTRPVSAKPQPDGSK
jgi:hypothetical protein